MLPKGLEKNMDFNNNADYYKPNFVLVAENPHSLKVLSDILPFTRPSHSEVLIVSWLGLEKFILNSKVFLICLNSLVIKFINNTTYATYLTLVSSYNKVINFPSIFSDIKNKYLEIVDIFSNDKLKRVWLIDVKLETRIQMKRLLKLINFVIYLVSKFYLLIFVLIISIGLGSFNNTDPDNSIFTNFLKNKSYVGLEQVETLSAQKATNLSVNWLQDVKDKRGIISHTVQQGETLASIANTYSIKQETIKYNNSLSGEVAPGQKLYIPWVDGYVHYTAVDVSSDTLQSKYKVDKDVIISLNNHLYNYDSTFFKAGSLILIPIDDYSVIEKIKSEEAKRIASEEAAAQAAKKAEEARQAALSKYSTSNSCVVANKNSSYGLIWPASGPITQCYGYTSFSYNYANNFHTGLDIDGETGDKIFSSKSGIVVDSGWSSGGYGIYVVIDHGNGLTTLYGHLSKTLVKNGDSISQGQNIGLMGSTGFSTGSHLHFEVRINNSHVNPSVYLP